MTFERSMKCPECGSPCWRNEIDVGVGVPYCDEWKCDNCEWDESQAFPMTETNWQDFLKVE